MEWSASEMCRWIKLLTDLDGCITGIADDETDADPERKAQSVWSESAAKAELAHFQQENLQVWRQFAHDQSEALFEQLAGCIHAQFFIENALNSVCEPKNHDFRKVAEANSAAVLAERGRLHFTVEELLRNLSVIAELADTVNELSGVRKFRRAYQTACVRFAAWTDYANSILAQERSRLEEEIRKQTGESEEKAEKRRQAFSERLRAMWEKSLAESGSGSAEDGDDAGRTAEKKNVNTAAALRKHDFITAFDPQSRMADYVKRMDLVQVPEDYRMPETLPDEIVFGTLVFDMEAAGFRQETIDFLAHTYPYLCTATELRMPLCLPLDGHMNCVFRFPGAAAETIPQLMSQLLTEMMMMLSAKHMSLLRIADAMPIVFADKLAVFNNLIGDGDPDTDEKVYGKVRTQPDDMKEVLDRLLEKRSDVSNRVLMGVYDSLLSYQQKNPAHDETYTVLTAILNPKNADGEVMEKIAQIAAAGSNCGIFTWFCDASMQEPDAGSEGENAEVTETLYSCMQHSFTYDKASGRYRYQLLDEAGSAQYPLWWEPLPFPNVRALTMPKHQRNQEIALEQAALLRQMQES